MNEVEPGQPDTTPAPEGSGERVGDRLRAAREAAGLTLAEVGQRTRVPLRHLTAIESSDFGALPSPTYAVGFARAYARAVGLDEVAAARDVRDELSKVDRAPEYVPYETADPERVPSRGIAVVGLGLAIAILVLVGLYYGTDLFRGQATAPMTTAAVPDAAPSAGFTPPAVATATAAAPRQVTLAAGDTEVWMRVYDANNDTLYLGTLAPGATFDVPQGADRPMINVGRPDQLRVTVDGQAVPQLGDGRRAIRDVPVDAVSIAARLAGTPASGPSPTPSATARGETRETARADRPRARASDRPALTETQRANLVAAQNPPPPATSNSASE